MVVQPAKDIIEEGNTRSCVYCSSQSLELVSDLYYHLVVEDTYNALFLSSAESKAFASYDCHITFGQSLQVFFEFASLDDNFIKVRVEVRVSNNVVSYGLVLYGQ